MTERNYYTVIIEAIVCNSILYFDVDMYIILSVFMLLCVQVLWANTEFVGCGSSVCANTTVVVCDYAPG